MSSDWLFILIDTHAYTHNTLLNDSRVISIVVKCWGLSTTGYTARNVLFTYSNKHSEVRCPSNKHQTVLNNVLNACNANTIPLHSAVNSARFSSVYVTKNNAQEFYRNLTCSSDLPFSRVEWFIGGYATISIDAFSQNERVVLIAQRILEFITQTHEEVMRSSRLSSVCLYVCVTVSRTTQKVVDEFRWKFF